VSTDARIAPEFRISLDGRPAPAALRASVTAVRVQSGLEGADRVELTLANEGLRWLDEKLLSLDTRLALEIGYASGSLRQAFVGEVVSQSATFPSSGMPTLTVAGQDARERMTRGSKLRWFAIPTPTIGNFPLPDQAVAGIVSLENGLVPIFEPVGAAIAVVLGGAEAAAAIDGPGSMQRLVRKQDDESDLDFLGRLAKENGWEMVIDHAGPLGGAQLRFLSPLDRLAPDVTLAYGASLLDFAPRVSNVGQIASITAYVWVAQIKTRFEVTVGWDWDRAALTIDVRPALMPAAEGGSEFVVDEPVTPSSAPRRILSELVPRLNGRLTGSGSCVGDPAIAPGGVLRLEGLGERFSGLWRVTQATHTIDGSGYRTGFEVRKEIWFGSVPLPEQGALPVRVTSPLGTAA
jgi:uncharacterized protein